MGVVQDSRIVWPNDGIWNKKLHLDGSTRTSGPVAIEMRPDPILLIHRRGDISRARLARA